MGQVVQDLKALDYPVEVKKAGYIIFRIESANGTSGINENYCGFQADSGRWPVRATVLPRAQRTPLLSPPDLPAMRWELGCI